VRPAIEHEILASRGLLAGSEILEPSRNVRGQCRDRPQCIDGNSRHVLSGRIRRQHQEQDGRRHDSVGTT